MYKRYTIVKSNKKLRKGTCQIKTNIYNNKREPGTRLVYNRFIYIISYTFWFFFSGLLQKEGKDHDNKRADSREPKYKWADKYIVLFIYIYKCVAARIHCTATRHNGADVDNVKLLGTANLVQYYGIAFQ